mmetsp:Transcript_50034/g.154751  ORF Transcript_50034/g.154751 Transcript_50034/m.154751 type:complete len:427 (+) Transcript_50034:79-1359(+)
MGALRADGARPGAPPARLRGAPRRGRRSQAGGAGARADGPASRLLAARTAGAGHALPSGGSVQPPRRGRHHGRGGAGHVEPLPCLVQRAGPAAQAPRRRLHGLPQRGARRGRLQHRGAGPPEDRGRLRHRPRRLAPALVAGHAGGPLGRRRGRGAGHARGGGRPGGPERRAHGHLRALRPRRCRAAVGAPAGPPAAAGGAPVRGGGRRGPGRGWGGAGRGFHGLYRGLSPLGRCGGLDGAQLQPRGAAARLRLLRGYEARPHLPRRLRRPQLQRRPGDVREHRLRRPAARPQLAGPARAQNGLQRHGRHGSGRARGPPPATRMAGCRRRQPPGAGGSCSRGTGAGPGGRRRLAGGCLPATAAWSVFRHGRGGLRLPVLMTAPPRLSSRMYGCRLLRTCCGSSPDTGTTAAHRTRAVAAATNTFLLM